MAEKANVKDKKKATTMCIILVALKAYERASEHNHMRFGVGASWGLSAQLDTLIGSLFGLLYKKEDTKFARSFVTVFCRMDESIGSRRRIRKLVKGYCKVT